MNTTAKTEIVKDLEERSIKVSREFNAQVELVWKACTESELLDQWWGPEPWHAETKSMDFRVGGYWLYAMVGPNGERHWGRTNYKAINEYKSYSVEDVFCDENGNVNPEMPTSKGSNVFTPTATGTRMEFKLIYPSEKDLQMIVEMGFEQGIAICFDQLDKVLSK